ncbi:MAG: aminotransferase class III-fold pyridoxal phosphate-dependent enzyme [Symploca sp. SIO2C1]|nr:aminotransferase class III-fold pyridoxal phosphate-dependent enzyme [Symploca sp. SIO2C1]
MDREPIAIIGMGCRFPEAKNPQAFWELLCNGRDAITEVPASRWDNKLFYDPDISKPGKTNSRWGGFLEQVDEFDPQFFGISPRETQTMDPQQRLLLELAWEALEDAGQPPEALAGTPTGVFMGVSSFDYYELIAQNPINFSTYTGTGNLNCINANRLSYFFDFYGPSMAIDTACSSSLVAVHLACQSLWCGESSLALVGGVHIVTSPWMSVAYAQGGFMAADGRCKTFDAKADGYVRSEGGGLVILKPLSQALANGDRIYALVKGSAINQDGRSNGLTAPNPLAQEAVLRAAYQNARVSPGQVEYIETHGTGTKLGDPIEMTALGTVLSEGRAPGDYCAIGSAKTNIGHLEAPAGIAGLIKVALSLYYRQIPPTLHFTDPNPYIKFDKLPLRVQETLTPWPEKSTPAIAGVSSFGFGGTNSHVVLAEIGNPSPTSPKEGSSEEQRLERPVNLLTLSAKTQPALEELVSDYENHLKKHPELSVGDVCYTANVGRSHFPYRLAVVTKSTQQLEEQLRTTVKGEETPGVLKSQKNVRKRPKLAFLFTGQGSQYVNMGRELYETQLTFRQALEQCEEILRPYLKHPLLEVLYPQEAQNSNSSLLDQTAYTQPAVFAIEYALAKLWESWGVKPKVVMGHSVGEYVAATVAGVFSLEDGLKLIALRGQLMQQLPAGGGMVSLLASESQVRQVIADYSSQIAIAAINGPESVVISGVGEALAEVCSKLEAMGIKTKPLQVSHAFHSPVMEPMLAEFEAVAKEITYHQPRIPLISNVTGKLVTDEITTAQYWVSHVREPVRFAQSMTTLQEEGYELFLEIGPKPILLGMGRQCLPEDVGVWLPSLRPPKQEWQQMLESLGQLYVTGMKIDWLGFNQNYPRQKVTLPTYPFQRQRYWLDLQENGHKLLGAISAINSSSEENPYHLEEQNLIIEKKDMSAKTPGATSRRREKIIAEICEIIAQELGFEEPSQVDIDNNLLELGADSLTLMAASRKVEKNYGVNITIRQFFEELTTVDTLAEYIDANLSPEWGQQETVETSSPPPQPEASSLPQLVQSSQTNLDLTSVIPETQGVSTVVERIMQQQLQIMSQQLAILQGKQVSGSNNGQALSGHSAAKVLHKPNQKGNLAEKTEISQPSTQLKQKVATVNLAHSSPSDYLRTPVQIEQQLNAILPELITQANLASYGEIPAELENLSVDYIVQALQEMAWFYQPTESFSTESAVQSLGVVSEQQRLFKRLLEILAEVGILKSTPQQWQVLQTLKGANPKEKSQRLLSQYPNAHAELTLLHRCASQLSKVLQGSINPLQLVFPEGDLTTATQLYQESPPAQVMNNLIQKAIAIALDKLPPNREVKLLEIGAGTGGTTSYLLPHLNPNQTEYTFTDLGGFFNARAKEKFRDYPYVRYQTLDIEENPSSQGFESQYYDVIIAANVLHATTSLTETLSHVRQLLAPGGILVLWEKTTPQRWLDLIFGLLKGWHKFNDFELRPDSPLLNKSQWQQFLKERGFGEVVTLPQTEGIPEALSLETVIIAQADTAGPKKVQSATRVPSKVALNQQQQSYLKEFIATYTKKTQKSQQMAQHYRPFLADKRATARWITELKEMRYPIVGESAHGAKIWDIDGNEYIDISLGFGVHLFGHNPQFITEAIQNWLKQGMQVGPQAKLAGEVAQLVHELTGMERVAFCNSGTEAMMTAVRLARLTTGRDKIVMFTNSYHGHFDGVLAVAPTNLEKNLKATPISPGVLENMVDDVIVLTYGVAESLEIIKAHAQELAAVLVEPVQSRRLDLQPKEFLQQLRQLTQQAGITLIFDEIITGFRIHPGGAQAWFGIKADIAAYGKCVGGGIPIGIVAGKANYLDGLDGGQWNYGDDSYPQKLQTFFGGTFNKNALTMTTAKAVLEYLKKQGTSLQENLNQRTSQLITRLNTYFKQEYLPIKMISCASLFQFVSSDNQSYTSQSIEIEVLVHHLIKKGLYIWEGRICFLSTVHTDKDIDYIIAAVKESISEMRQGGFWQKQNQHEQTSLKESERVRGAL